MICIVLIVGFLIHLQKIYIITASELRVWSGSSVIARRPQADAAIYINY